MTTGANMVLADGGSMNGGMHWHGAYAAGPGYMAQGYHHPWGQTPQWSQPAAQSQIYTSPPQYHVSQNRGPQMPPPVLQTAPVSSMGHTTTPAVPPEPVNHWNQPVEPVEGSYAGDGSDAADKVQC